jgi:hypothetical protein
MKFPWRKKDTPQETNPEKVQYLHRFILINSKISKVTEVYLPKNLTMASKSRMS